MNTVWSATWRFICQGGQASCQRQTALGIPVSRTLSDSKSIRQGGKYGEHIRLTSIVSRGFHDDRATYLGFSHQSRKESGVVVFILNPSRWKSTSSASDRAGKATPRSNFTYLSKPQVAKVLGRNVDFQEGNSLLNQLQHQRISGTLDQGVSAPEIMLNRAIAWLRKNYPMDEDAAIIARLDKELEKEERGLGRVNEAQHGTKASDNYSISVLDQIKEKNKLKAAKEKEAKEKEEQGGENGKGSTSAKTAPRAIVSRRTESAEWVKKYKEKATSNCKEPPKMTKFQRLWPATLMTLAVVGLSALFAQCYYPPSWKARLWPDIPPAAATVFAMVGVNATVFLLWRIPQMWQFMNRWFVLTPGSPYSFTLVGNIFSHQSFPHLLTNMAMLWFVGAGLHNEIGRGNFLAVFFTCGVVSSYVSLSYHVSRSIFYTSSLGASGAVCGLVATWLSLDSQKSLSFMVLPDWFSGWTPYSILGMMVAIDILGFIRALRVSGGGGAKIGVDHMAHLGGYAGGLSCAQVLRYQRRQRQQMEEEKKKSVGSLMRPLKAD